eukprot:scaffold300355_cov79-Cyclotella_meneghiniana.AAC.1
MDPIDLTSLDIAVQSNDGTKAEDSQPEASAAAAAEQSSESTSDDDYPAADAKLNNDNVNLDDSTSMEASDDGVDSSEEDNLISNESVAGIADSSHAHHDEVLSGTIDAVDHDNHVDDSLNTEDVGVKLMQPSEGEDGSEEVKNTESSDADAEAVDDSSSEQQTVDNTLHPSDDVTQNDSDSVDDVQSELDQDDESPSAQLDQDLINQTTNNETVIGNNDAHHASETNATNNNTETTSSEIEIEAESKDDDEDERPPQILVDYAAKVSGGQILEKSPTLKGTSNLLTGDMDRYAIAPCQDKKYVVIGLSEDILVKIIQLANYERYSSHVKEFQVLASQEYPTQNNDQWTDLGTYTALSKSGEQSFELKEPAWARYLKFKFLSHYGVEHYCTVSQIKVHGSTMLQGFHEQWIESEMDNEDGDNVESNQNDDEEGQVQERGEVAEERKEMKKSSVNEQERATLDENSEQRIDEQASEFTEADEVDGETDNDDTESAQEATSDELGFSDEPEHTAQGTDAVVNENADVVKEAEPSSTDNANIADPMEETNNVIEPSVSKLSEGSANEYNSDIEQVNAPQNNESPRDETLDESQIKEEESDLKETTLPIDKSMAASEAKEDDSMNMEVSIASGDDSSTTESEQTIETHADNESNSTIHAVADAVLGLGKAAVAHVTDELKHVKEAVQSADAVTEIKKMIRTTIAATEEGGETELDAMNELAIIDEDSQEANIMLPVNDVESETKQKDSVVDENNNHSAIDEQEGEPLVEPELPGINGTCTENSTNATETSNTPTNNLTATNSTTPEEWSTSETVKSSSQEDKTSAEKNKTLSIAASTLKVNQTATLPRKRDTNSKSVEDHITQLIARYPDASCIKDLDFQTSKASFKAKQAVVGAAVGAAGVRTMEPVFQKITSEIKSVQSTQHQYEQFVSAIKVCYEKVLADIADDVDVMQSKFDSRLTVLEMMLLERRDVERSKPPFGLMMSNIFPISTVAALPSNEKYLYMAVTVIFILILRVIRVKGKKVSTDNAAVAAKEQPNANQSDNNIASSLSKKNETVIGSEIELSHAIVSCDESVDSISLPKSEKTGATFRSTSQLKGSRQDFDIKRAKRNGRTP